VRGALGERRPYRDPDFPGLPVLSHGSLNLAQFRSGFDFFGAGLGLFFCVLFPRLQVTTLGQGFLGVMGVKVFGFNGRFF
jgi:hypothetical protein